MLNSQTGLSTDLNVIATEVTEQLQKYKNKENTKEAIFEIGRRLKHVKENDLAHGEWTNWCENKINMTIMQANKFIKVFEELSKDVNIKSTLGIEALYQIATIPEEERTKPHTIPSTGEVKTVDEMTVRELREG